MSFIPQHTAKHTIHVSNIDRSSDDTIGKSIHKLFVVDDDDQTTPSSSIDPTLYTTYEGKADKTERRRLLCFLLLWQREMPTETARRNDIAFIREAFSGFRRQFP